MKFLLRIFWAALLIFIFKSNINSQWVVDYDPNLVSPYYISVVDTGTVWCLGYTGYWDNIEVMSKTPQLGWMCCMGNDLPVNVRYTCIAGINDTTAFVGDSFGRIYKTTNYGFNWSVILNAGNNYSVIDIKFSKVNRNAGYIFCARNDYGAGVFKIYKTTNYGNTWQLFTPYFGNITIDNKPQVWVTDADHAWIGLWCISQNCPYVQIAYTTNGGINWLTSNVESGRQGIQSVAFSYDNQFGIATSFKLWTPNNLLISTNGGLNWNFSDTIQGGNVLSFITVPESSVWYMNGMALYPDTTSEPYIYKSSNNGVNWIKMTSEDSIYTISDMDGVKLNNKIYMWAAYPGKVLKLVDSAVVIGINNEGSIIPDKYKLEQNFPNPFNPNSIIRYAIPKNSYVTIKIYDLQGREISVILNNEFKSAGKYSVNFNGVNFASGVYFYRIEVGDFVQSKKMVLVK